MSMSIVMIVNYLVIRFLDSFLTVACGATTALLVTTPPCSWRMLCASAFRANMYRAHSSDCAAFSSANTLAIERAMWFGRSCL
mmetsp:Transcript_51761/g.85864  ORF Transcript_51761/g.85864 Transcript_51761/m.85864 type:complete len:83 (-) Transcript_51761:822-1070(-)